MKISIDTGNSTPTNSGDGNTPKTFAIITAIAVAGYGAKKGIDCVANWIKKRQQVKAAKAIIDYRNSQKGDASSTPDPEKVFVPEEESLGDMITKPSAPLEPIIPGLLYYNTITVLAGATGVGKSSLALQIGVDCAGGTASLLTDELVAPEKFIVYYYDGELKYEDFKRRFPEGHQYPSLFRRLQGRGFKTTGQLVNDIKTQRIPRILEAQKNAIFIIDNLKSCTDLTLHSNEVRDFYDDLAAIQDETSKKGCFISFIVVDHVNKSASYPLSNTQLSGSATVSDLADNAIIIAETRFGEGTRMMCVLKNRKELKLGQVYILKSVATPYLHFEFDKFMQEDDARPLTPREQQREKRASNSGTDDSSSEMSKKEIVISLARAGKTKAEIERETGISRPTIIKYWPEDVPSKPDRPKKSEDTDKS